MTTITTKAGRTQIDAAGMPAEVAADCVLIALNAIKQYAEITGTPTGRAACEVSQIILQYITRGDNNASE